MLLGSLASKGEGVGGGVEAAFVAVVVLSGFLLIFKMLSVNSVRELWLRSAQEGQLIPKDIDHCIKSLLVKAITF